MDSRIPSIGLTLGLIGFPLSLSLSPRLHSAALQAMAVNGEYNLYPVEPGERAQVELSRLVQSLRDGEINGLNVTVPFKQTVIPLLDDMTDRARAIGAVNTISCMAGRVLGDNTDAPGFLSDFNRLLKICSSTGEHFDAIHPIKHALVLGAGGAARAVIYALWTAGWHVTCAARRAEQASSLVRSFLAGNKSELLKSANLEAVPLEIDSLRYRSLHSTAPISAVINASSAGMYPLVSTSPWPEGLPLPAEAMVYDLVYKPPVTSFMQTARSSGLTASNGLGMLIEQAALALELWSGRSVPRDAMWEAVASQPNPGISR